MTAFLLVLLAATSQINVYPAAAILVVAAMAIVVAVRVVSGAHFAFPGTLIVGNYAYWLLSIFLVAFVPLGAVLSYDFFRFDGRNFYAYIPMLFLLSSKLTEGSARLVLLIWLVVTAAIAIGGIVEYAGLYDIPGVELIETTVNGQLLFKGFQESHNATGTYYCIVAITWLVLLFGPGSRASSWPLPRPALQALVLTVLVAAVLSGSREAYLGTVAASIWLVLRSPLRGSALRALLAGAVVVAGVLWTQEDIRNRIFETSTDEPNVANRLELWDQAPHLIFDSPILGIGFSRWNDVNQRTGELEPLRVGFPGIVMSGAGYPSLTVDDNAHNSYLMLMAELGIVGLALMLSVWVILWRKMLAILTSTVPGSLPYSLAFAGTGLFFFLLAASLVGHAMASPSTVIALSIPIGLVLALRAPDPQEVPRARAAALRRSGSPSGIQALPDRA